MMEFISDFGKSVSGVLEMKSEEYGYRARTSREMSPGTFMSEN